MRKKYFYVWKYRVFCVCCGEKFPLPGQCLMWKSLSVCLSCFSHSNMCPWAVSYHHRLLVHDLKKCPTVANRGKLLFEPFFLPRQQLYCGETIEQHRTGRPSMPVTFQIPQMWQCDSAWALEREHTTVDKRNWEFIVSSVKNSSNHELTNSPNVVEMKRATPSSFFLLQFFCISHLAAMSSDAVFFFCLFFSGHLLCLTSVLWFLTIPTLTNEHYALHPSFIW